MTASPHVRFSSRRASSLYDRSAQLRWILLPERFDDEGFQAQPQNAPHFIGC